MTDLRAEKSEEVKRELRDLLNLPQKVLPEIESEEFTSEALLREEAEAPISPIVPPAPTPAEIRIAEGQRRSELAELERMAEQAEIDALAKQVEKEARDVLANAEKTAQETELAETLARCEVASLAGYRVKAGKRNELQGYWLTRPDKSKSFFMREARAWKATPDYRNNADAAARDLVKIGMTFHRDSSSWAGEMKGGSGVTVTGSLADCICELALAVSKGKQRDTRKTH